MPPFNPQPRRRPLLLNPGHGHRTPAPSIWNGPNKIVYYFLGVILFLKLLSILHTMVFTCDERGGFWCQNTASEARYLDAAPKIDVRVVRGRDVPMHCEGPPGGCGAVVVDGVCVRSCGEGDGGVEVGAQITRPPSEEVGGTPTVDEASSWWWDRKSVPDGGGGGGAECTVLCGSEADVKSGIKLQQYIGGFGLGLGLQPGPHTPTPKPSTKQNAPASTTMEQPDSTQTGDIPLQTNIESGEPRGVVQGVMWNSCASSALLLGLVAIGVVVLL